MPPWGDDMHLAFAELWSFYQGQVPRLTGDLGPDRSLVLRYEDVVRDPDATRRRLALFLGRSADATPVTAPSDIVLPWESWKARALDPVADDRVDSWHDHLDGRRAREIALVCARGMRRFDYPVDPPRRLSTALSRIRLGPVRFTRLARYARARRLHLRTVERVRL